MHELTVELLSTVRCMIKKMRKREKDNSSKQNQDKAFIIICVSLHFLGFVSGRKWVKNRRGRVGRMECE